jgi:hypothetical protein
MRIQPKDRFGTTTEVNRIKFGWQVDFRATGLEIEKALPDERAAAVWAFVTLGSLLMADGADIQAITDKIVTNDFGLEEMGWEERDDPPVGGTE